MTLIRQIWPDPIKLTQLISMDSFTLLNSKLSHTSAYHKIFKIVKNRRSFYLLLSISIIIASVALLWVYRDPISKKYLLEKPRNYNLARFNSKIRYVITKADTMRGNGNPGDRIKVILTEPKIKIKTTADKGGNWRITIPDKLTEKRYKMAVITFDKNGKNPKIKFYRIRVESDNKLANSQIYKNLQSFYRKNLQKWLNPTG